MCIAVFTSFEIDMGAPSIGELLLGAPSNWCMCITQLYSNYSLWCMDKAWVPYLLFHVSKLKWGQCWSFGHCYQLGLCNIWWKIAKMDCLVERIVFFIPVVNNVCDALSMLIVSSIPLHPLLAPTISSDLVGIRSL